MINSPQLANWNVLNGSKKMQRGQTICKECVTSFTVDNFAPIPEFHSIKRHKSALLQKMNLCQFTNK